MYKLLKEDKAIIFLLKRWINYIPTPVKFIFRKKSLRKGFKAYFNSQDFTSFVRLSGL